MRAAKTSRPTLCPQGTTNECDITGYATALQPRGLRFHVMHCQRFLLASSTAPSVKSATRCLKPLLRTGLEANTYGRPWHVEKTPASFHLGAGNPPSCKIKRNSHSPPKNMRPTEIAADVQQVQLFFEVNILWSKLYSCGFKGVLKKVPKAVILHSIRILSN